MHFALIGNIAISNAVVPTVSTQAVSDIATTTATGNGNVTATGGANVTERGIYYSTTNGFADGAGTKVSTTGDWSATGTFTQPITGLTANTTYYAKAFATNSAGTGYGSQVSTDTPVPVELVSFTAVVDEDGVKLKWETATEINNYGFEVERQILNQVQNDSQWETLSFVEGHGNSNSPKYYEFVDETPLADSAEYRLKQIDTDGKYTYYHETVRVNGFGITDVEEVIPTEFSLSQNYPNPFNPNTTISYGLKTATNVELTVYNVLGQEIAMLVNQKQRAGNYEINFDASNLSSGTYLYKITAGEFVSVKKLLLMK